MDQPIRRDGAWWHRAPDGTWMRYDEASGAWGPSADAPSDAETVSTNATVLPEPQEDDKRRRRLPVPKGRNQIVAAVVAGALLVGGAGYGSMALLRSEPAGQPAEAAARDDTGKGKKGKGKDKRAARKEGKKSSKQAAPATPSPAQQATRLKRAFIASADEICAKANRRMRSLAMPTTARELLEFVGTVRIYVRKLRAGLGGLTAPSDDRRAWKRSLEMIDKMLNTLDRIVLAAGRGDLATAKKLQARLEELGDRHTKWARDYGFKDCAEDS